MATKTLRYTLKSGQDWNTYIDMLNLFINDINKHLKDKVSQYLLLLLFYNYVNEKQVYAKIIADNGASGMAAMGKVMGLASAELAGKADGKTISTIVKKLLS